MPDPRAQYFASVKPKRLPVVGDGSGAPALQMSAISPPDHRGDRLTAPVALNGRGSLAISTSSWLRVVVVAASGGPVSGLDLVIDHGISGCAASDTGHGSSDCSEMSTMW